MWQQFLDIVFDILMVFFGVLCALNTLCIVVEPIWEAVSKRVRNKRYGNMGKD